MKFNDLSIQEKAAVIKLGVGGGLRSLLEIQGFYDGLDWPGDNQYVNIAAKGGNLNGPDDPPEKWKALDNIKYHVYPDTTFTRDKTGYGSIEVFDKNNGDTIRYPNGYTIINPYPGENTIYYNPKYNDEQDIRLDALHLMYQDPVYDALSSEYRYWSSGDVEDDAVKFRDMDMKRYGKAYPLGVYIRNQQDALLRNAFIKGDKEYVKSKNYDDVEQLRKDNWFLMPYIDRIHEYLNTGKKPLNLLPEVVITPDEYAYGGGFGDDNPTIFDRWRKYVTRKQDYYNQLPIVNDVPVALPEVVVQGEDPQQRDYESLRLTLKSNPFVLASAVQDPFMSTVLANKNRNDQMEAALNLENIYDKMLQATMAMGVGKSLLFGSIPEKVRTIGGIGGGYTLDKALSYLIRKATGDKYGSWEDILRDAGIPTSIAMLTNPAYWIGGKYGSKYANHVGRNATEAVVRLGDLANAPAEGAKILLKDPNTYKFVFGNRPDLAYKVGAGYSGEAAVTRTEFYNPEYKPLAHKGDLIDVYFGKSKSRFPLVGRDMVSAELNNYIDQNYAGREVPVYDMGDVVSPYKIYNTNDLYLYAADMSSRYQSTPSVMRYNKGLFGYENLLDPGNFHVARRSMSPMKYIQYNEDLFKWNPKDYFNPRSESKPKNLLTRGATNLGLKAINEYGNPFVSLWNDVVKVSLPSEFKKGGSIHIKPENRGKFTALKKRTGHSASWFKAHGTPALKKMATFALNARKWHHKHPDGGSLFDRWRLYMQNNTIDVPMTFNLPEVQVTAQAPRPGDVNYDKYIANTYDAWKRGDVDINTLPTETRNRVRGYSGTIAALHGMEEAAKVAGITAAVPTGIIGGISSIPYLYNLVTNPVGLKLTKQLLASEIGGRSVDLTSLAITGKSWNENIGNLTYDITGWNPNNSILGLVAVSFTNPGYMGLEGAKALGKSIAYRVNNKINDLAFKYGVNKLVENTEYPTHQFYNWTNYRSNVRTRKVIDKVLRDNPNLPYEWKQLLRYAAKNMSYTNNADFHTYQPINDKLEGNDLPGLFYDDNTTRLYEISVPKYDQWSNTHEIGHIVDDVAPGKFSSKHGVIPEYMYDASGQENKVELFADIFANTYSKRKPYDYLTHKPGLAESLKNRVDITKGYNFDEGFQNIIDKETGKILNDPHPNRYLSQQLNITNSKAAIVHTLDEATHGLFMDNNFQVLIKPLAEGADIEKQLSKTGTISRNSLDAYIKKQGKFYQDIMNDVLDSDFSGINKIDYKQFKKAISRKLPEYYRKPQEDYKDYGLDRLGLELSYEYMDPRTAIYKYNDGDLLENGLNTFTFESPNFIGNEKHYSGNPIGHSRTYTTKEEPEILHVMESQSDWALGYEAPRLSLKGLNKHSERIERLTKEIADNEEKLKLGFAPDGHKLEYDHEIQLVKDLILRDKDRLKELLSTLDEIDNPNLYKHMTENYESRLILENLRYAAEQGQTRMRYPTRETAAKIEGYPEIDIYTNENGDIVTPREATTYGDKLDKKIYGLIEERESLELQAARYNNAVVGSVQFNIFNKIYDRISNINDELFKIMETKPKLKIKKGYSVKKGYDNQFETILKKYSDFPKQYRKLFKDADVRNITDSKGNTWYEVDVPENYRKGKAEILMNLAPYLGLGLSSTALNKKKALGGLIKPFSYLPIPEVRY